MPNQCTNDCSVRESKIKVYLEEYIFTSIMSEQMDFSKFILNRIFKSKLYRKTWGSIVF